MKGMEQIHVPNGTYVVIQKGRSPAARSLRFVCVSLAATLLLGLTIVWSIQGNQKHSPSGLRSYLLLVKKEAELANGAHLIHRKEVHSNTIHNMLAEGDDDSDSNSDSDSDSDPDGDDEVDDNSTETNSTELTVNATTNSSLSKNEGDKDEQDDYAHYQNACDLAKDPLDLTLNCWLSKHKDPDDVKRFLAAHAAVNTEQWFEDHRSKTVETEQWFQDHTKPNGFSYGEWLKAHGLNREDMVRHARTEILAATHSMLEDNSNSSVQTGEDFACGLDCWLAKHPFDPEDVEDYLKRHPTLDMEEWLRNHSGTFNWADWLEHHGLSREEKARDARTALLVAVLLVDAGGAPGATSALDDTAIDGDATTAGGGDVYGGAGCDMECWLSHHADPEDIEGPDGWFARHRAEIVNMSAWLLAHPDDPEDVEDFLRRHRDFDMETWYRNRTAKEFNWGQWLHNHGLTREAFSATVQAALLAELRTSLAALRPRRAAPVAKSASGPSWATLNSEAQALVKAVAASRDRLHALPAARSGLPRGFMSRHGVSTAKLTESNDVSRWLASVPEFNLTSWLDAQTTYNYNVSTWLREHEAMDGGRDHAGAWLEFKEAEARNGTPAGVGDAGTVAYKLTPAGDELGKVNNGGFCCCSIDCTEASEACCGPWFTDYRATWPSQLASARARAQSRQPAAAAANRKTRESVAARRARSPTAAPPPLRPPPRAGLAAPPLFTKLEAADPPVAVNASAPPPPPPVAGAWVCRETCTAAPLRVGSTCDVECLSVDGVNCLRPALCAAAAANSSAALTSAGEGEGSPVAAATGGFVRCGASMVADWGTDGYSQAGHWCACGLADPALAAAAARCREAAATGEAVPPSAAGASATPPPPPPPPAFYRPDPGSDFARTGDPELDTLADGRNHWPDYVDDGAPQYADGEG